MVKKALMAGRRGDGARIIVAWRELRAGAAQPAALGDSPFREKLKAYDIARDDPSDVPWNFEKFLPGRDGMVIARFAPDIAADDPRLMKAIDDALRA
jgi:glutathione peroxidase